MYYSYCTKPTGGGSFSRPKRVGGLLNILIFFLLFLQTQICLLFCESSCQFLTRQCTRSDVKICEPSLRYEYIIEKFNLYSPTISISLKRKNSPNNPIDMRNVSFFSAKKNASLKENPLSLPTIILLHASPPSMSPKDQTPHGRSLLLAVEPPEKQAPLLNPPKNAPSTSRAPPRRVDHTYRDFSQFSFDKPHSNKKAPTHFPAKLHKILSTPEFSHVSHDAMYLNQLLNSIWREGESFNCLLTRFCSILSISLTYLISSDYFLDGEIHFLFLQWCSVIIIISLSPYDLNLLS